MLPPSVLEGLPPLPIAALQQVTTPAKKQPAILQDLPVDFAANHRRCAVQPKRRWQPIKSPNGSEYFLEKELGSGHYATVWKAHAYVNEQFTKSNFAIKISKPRDPIYETAYEDAQIREEKHLMKIHLNQQTIASTPIPIIQCMEGFSLDGHRYTVLELLSDSLYTIQQTKENKRFTLQDIRLYAKQLLEALAILKREGIIHTDLKPENILSIAENDPRICLIDLGSAEIPKSSEKPWEIISRFIQPLAFQAPEVALGFRYDEKVDIWSLGCVLAEFLTGNNLLQKEEPKKKEGPPNIPPENSIESNNRAMLLSIAKRICPIPSRLLEASCFSKDAKFCEEIASFQKENLIYTLFNTYKIEELTQEEVIFFDLIKQMLEIDPANRIDPEKALQHPFFQEFAESQGQTEEEAKEGSSL